MPLEKLLIVHCSPTLASLKIANLFSCHYETDEELEESMAYWNTQMKAKGIRLEIMRKRNRKALIYVCRFAKLEEKLGEKQTMQFMKAYGYEGMDINHALGHLRERLSAQEGFPHEIGIFLGYPLEDVVGFIRNEGKNFEHSGLWKVYGNRENAIRVFGKYKKCTDIYLRLWNNGRSVHQLTVAA